MRMEAGCDSIGHYVIICEEIYGNSLFSLDHKGCHAHGYYKRNFNWENYEFILGEENVL